MRKFVAASTCALLAGHAAATTQFAFTLVPDDGGSIVGNGSISFEGAVPESGTVGSWGGLDSRNGPISGISMGPIFYVLAGHFSGTYRYTDYTVQFADHRPVGLSVSAVTTDNSDVFINRAALTVSGTSFTFGQQQIVTSYGMSLGITPRIPTVSETGHIVFASAVPEPATYGLMMAGLVLIGCIARRRHRA
jgi:hypothetical protein